MSGFIGEIFTVSGEKIKDSGEDSFIAEYKEHLAIIGVFDGCGGLGSKKYPEFENRTGAYIASRNAANATKKWFGTLEKFDMKQPDEVTEMLKTEIKNNLCRAECQESGIKGDLAKSFPTTVSAVLLKEEKKCVNAEFIWAGDSRGYILEESGLVQLTRDDIIGSGDAYVNLSEDARLSNYAHANGDFVLNRRIAKISSPAVIISATDGCFGYFKTPMEFEYLILNTLTEAENAEMWKNLLYDKIKAVSGDDFSMCVCIVGGLKFEKLKKYFKKRYKYLKKEYISKLEKADGKKCEKLWKKYKEEYYG